MASAMASAMRRRRCGSWFQVAAMSSMIRGKTRPSCKATAKKVRRAGPFGRAEGVRGLAGALGVAGAGSADAECSGGGSLRRDGGSLFSVARGFQLVQLRADVACEQRSEQRAIHDGVQGLFVLQATNLVEAGGAFESAKKQLDFPPQAIQLRDVVWRKVGTGKRGQVVAVLATERDTHDADDRRLAVFA